MPDVELCVIGGGAGGFAAASAGVALGLSVTLISEDADGAAPRDSDLVIAHLQRAAREKAAASDPRGFDFGALRHSLDQTLRAATPDRRLVRLAAMNVRVVRGHARFVDHRTVIAGGKAIRARRFVLATGTEGAVAPEGVPPELFVTPETLGDLTGLPTHLMVLGGDGVAVSVAQSFCRFGAAVTLLAADGLLPDTDPELAAPLRHRLQADGVILMESDPRPAFSRTPAGLVAAWAAGPQVTLSHVFAAGSGEWTGSDLGLADAGVGTGADGLALSASLRTTNSRVYALTAVSPQAAQAQVAVIMKAAFFRLPARYRPDRIPVCTPTDPQIATVGLTEAEARKTGPVSVWRWPLAETDEARLRRDTVGHVKVLSDRRGRVLGAGIVGGDAAGQIGFWSLALTAGLTMTDLAKVPLPGPSWSEATRRVVVTHAAHQLQGRWVKRALAILNRLG